MAGNEYFPVRPKTPAEGEFRTRVAAGSSLAVLGIYVEALREYFTNPHGSPYRWSTDANTSEIIIEVASNPQVEVNNPSRGIYVSRNGTTPQQIAIGDRLGVELRSGQESFLAMMTVQMQVDCVCAASGECDLLADFVHMFLLAGKRVFEAQYGLHSMSLPVLGPVRPFNTDTQYFMASITFDVTFQFRWTHVRIAPLLEELHLHTLTRYGTPPQPGTPADELARQAEEAFMNAALESIEKSVPSVRAKDPVTDVT